MLLAPNNMVKGLLGFADKKITQHESKGFASKMGSPNDCFEFIWNKLTPALMTLFKDQIIEMEGTKDVENFAAFLNNQITAFLLSDAPFPSTVNEKKVPMVPLSDKEKEKLVKEKIDCLIKEIFVGKKASTFFLTTNYYRKGNGASSFTDLIGFAKVSFDSEEGRKQVTYYRNDPKRTVDYGQCFFSPKVGKAIANRSGREEVLQPKRILNLESDAALEHGDPSLRSG
jgi:hypothetical protein